MATYTKGFKKQHGETFLLKTIVAMILVVLLIVGVAFIYDLATETGDYADFADEKIASYDKILTQKDADLVQLQNYVVYFYNAADQDCIDAQRQVLKLAEKLNKDGKVFFLVDLDALTQTTPGDRDAFLLAVGKSSVFLNQSPMLITVADGVFSTAYTGRTAVVETLEQIEAGTYTPFN
jgi:hypothetical protein